MRTYSKVLLAMPERPFSEYAARNTAPILEILQREFREQDDRLHVLEIGSGTGQHAVAFAAAMPQVHWQTSDLVENHAGIAAQIANAALENVSGPLALDVRADSVEIGSCDAVYSANTAHIMGIDAVTCMFALVGEVLRPGGVFCLYGPFRVGGAFNAPSNEAFDNSLRARDPVMGIRDLERLDEFATTSGLERQRLYAVPSNNCVAVWTKRAAA